MNKEFIVNRIIAFFEEKNLIFTYNEKEQFFSTGFSLLGKLQNVNLMIALGDNDYVVNATLPLKVDESSLSNMSLLFSAINYRLKNGAFTLDLNDGSLHYKVYEKCYGEELPDQQILDSIMLPVTMVDQHSESILAVIFNTKDISDILNEFKLDDEQNDKSES